MPDYSYEDVDIAEREREKTSLQAEREDITYRLRLACRPLSETTFAISEGDKIDAVHLLPELKRDIARVVALMNVLESIQDDLRHAGIN